MSEMTVPRFDITANQLSLDFTNTLEDRLEAKPTEMLNTYSDLLAWSFQVQIMTERDVQLLQEKAERSPGEAEQTLQRAREMREALFRIFLEVANGTTVAQDDMDIFNAYLSGALARACLVVDGDAFAWDWKREGVVFEQMFWPILRSAAHILTTEERENIRVCASDDCNWLFYDTSKNHTRRWCNMKTCGNRAKAKGHYERKKQKGQAGA